MFKKSFTWAAVALPVISIIFASGCGTQTSHPNQINAFDGGTYDTLLLAHGALVSLEANVTTSYPKYVPTFNQATAAYEGAYTAYVSFRSKPTTQAEVAVTINNLTVAIVAIENAFQTDMHASTTSIAQIRSHAKRIRKTAAQNGISVSDLLTELEIATAVASAISQAGPYGRMASMIIQTTSAALAAETAQAGQPIDLSLIQPIAAIQ